MAGDWIKMRVNLVTHPKVIALSEELSYSAEYQDWSGMHGFMPSIGGSKAEFDEGVTQALRVTRYVTVAALLRFWGYANEHSKDDFIGSLRVSDIDEIVGVPGFGRALESVGWVEYEENLKGCALPNFSEYNQSSHERSAGAKSSAQRQKEYRDRKKAEAVTDHGDVTRNVTSNVTSNRREEKRREDISSSLRSEDKRDSRFDALAHLVSRGVPESVASDWIKHRRTLKAAPTQTAIDGISKEAAKANIALSDALAMCCQRGWRGFKAEWVAEAIGYKQQTFTDKRQERDSAFLSAIGMSPRSNERVITGEVLP